ncbi:MAG: type III-A CRISPR-associated protein Csm2 [Pleomorphochaeta sp.]
MLELTKDLLTNEPEKIAIKEMEDARNKSKASSTQIRKFYDDFLLLHTKAHRDEESEKSFKENILPLIAFSKAKLAYSVGRDIIHNDFRNEIVKKVDQIDNLKDFDNFILFYQALIGYTKYYSKPTSLRTNTYQKNNKKQTYKRYN